MELAITNVVNISVSEVQAGIGEYNVNNLAIFTRETAEVSFGTDGYKIYISPTDVATDFGTSSQTYKMAVSVFSQQPNILAGGGYLVVILFESLETLDAAITRTEGLVQYFGIMACELSGQSEILAAAAVVQALNKMIFFVSRSTADVEVGGALDLLRTGNYSKSRGLYYGEDNDTDALVMMSAYAARALSTNFDGSNTTQTMHLKDLVGVQADPSMTQTILTKCQAAGVDVYASFQGVPKIFTSGKNGFFDDVYNLEWFVGALQVAGFNALAQTGTKLPQTESGMASLKAAYRQVCERAINNQYAAPGAWNSPTTFGSQEDLLLNIAQRGYYIYAQPVSQQSQTAREARQAPVVQIALKSAGAIHSSQVIVNVNA